MRQSGDGSVVRVAAVVIAVSGLTGIADDVADLVNGHAASALDHLLLLVNSLAVVAGIAVLARRSWARVAALAWTALLATYAVIAIVTVLAPAGAWWPGAVMLLVVSSLSLIWLRLIQVDAPASAPP